MPSDVAENRWLSRTRTCEPPRVMCAITRSVRPVRSGTGSVNVWSVVIVVESGPLPIHADTHAGACARAVTAINEDDSARTTVIDERRTFRRSRELIGRTNEMAVR